MLQVIGAGLGRTGTHSLALALVRLGFGPCYTLPEVEMNPGHVDLWNDALEGKGVDWETLFQDYHSAVEWPSVSFLRSLLVRFPEAKVILTMRDAESWYESAAATIFPGLEISAQNPDLAKRHSGGMLRRLILAEMFSGRYREKEYAIGVYEAHVQEVTSIVPPGRLLQYWVSQGWQPLCEFLGVPEPDEPFPRANTRASMLASAPDWARELMEQNRWGKGNVEQSGS